MFRQHSANNSNNQQFAPCEGSVNAVDWGYFLVASTLEHPPTPLHPLTLHKSVKSF